MNTDDCSVLRRHARHIRVNVVRSLAAAGSGHTGGSLGCADILTTLYFNVMDHDPANPSWGDRDRFILSIGHVAPVLYATLAEAGYFAEAELLTLRKLGSRLQGHPGRDHGLPGLELSAGSLGQGLSVAVGLSLGARIRKQEWKTYVLMGDGEIQEGSVWEAAMSAAHHKLDNLVAIIDRNRLQIDGPTSKVMEPEPLANKWTAFGWNVLQCDGNDIPGLIEAFGQAMAARGLPSVILANTRMGKGVAEIENDHRWHGRAPTKEEADRFIHEILSHDE